MSHMHIVSHVHQYLTEYEACSTITNLALFRPYLICNKELQISEEDYLRLKIGNCGFTALLKTESLQKNSNSCNL